MAGQTLLVKGMKAVHAIDHMLTCWSSMYDNLVVLLPMSTLLLYWAKVHLPVFYMP